MKYRYELFETKGGFGYNILAGERMIIHQPHMPCVAGVVIMTKEEAEKIARCVCNKISQLDNPAITLKDLSVLDCI